MSEVSVYCRGVAMNEPGCENCSKGISQDNGVWCIHHNLLMEPMDICSTYVNDGETEVWNLDE